MELARNICPEAEGVNELHAATSDQEVKRDTELYIILCTKWDRESTSRLPSQDNLHVVNIWMKWSWQLWKYQLDRTSVYTKRGQITITTTPAVFWYRIYRSDVLLNGSKFAALVSLKDANSQVIEGHLLANAMLRTRQYILNWQRKSIFNDLSWSSLPLLYHFVQLVHNLHLGSMFLKHILTLLCARVLASVRSVRLWILAHYNHWSRDTIVLSSNNAGSTPIGQCYQATLDERWV